MDAYLAVASKRDQCEYAERPVPTDAVRRILDAGRIAGSAKNRQPWRFLVLGPAGWSTRLPRPSTPLPTCSAPRW